MLIDALARSLFCLSYLLDAQELDAPAGLVHQLCISLCVELIWCFAMAMSARAEEAAEWSHPVLYFSGLKASSRTNADNCLADLLCCAHGSGIEAQDITSMLQRYKARPIMKSLVHGCQTAPTYPARPVDEVTTRSSMKGWPDPESLKAPGRPKTSRGRLEAASVSLSVEPEAVSPSSRPATGSEALAVISPESQSGKTTPSHSLTFRPSSSHVTSNSEAVSLVHTEPEARHCSPVPGQQADGQVLHRKGELAASATSADDGLVPTAASRAPQISNRSPDEGRARSTSRRSLDEGRARSTIRRSLDEGRPGSPRGAGRPCTADSKAESINKGAWKPAGPGSLDTQANGKKGSQRQQLTSSISHSRHNAKPSGVSDGLSRSQEQTGHKPQQSPVLPSSRPQQVASRDSNGIPASGKALNDKAKPKRTEISSKEAAANRVTDERASKQLQQQQPSSLQSTQNCFQDPLPAVRQEGKKGKAGVSAGEHLRPPQSSAQQAPAYVALQAIAQDGSEIKKVVPADKDMTAQPKSQPKSGWKMQTSPEAAKSSDIDIQPATDDTDKPNKLLHDLASRSLQAYAGSRSTGATPLRRQSSLRAATSANKLLPSFGNESSDALLSALRADAASESRRMSNQAASSWGSQNGGDGGDFPARSLAVSRTGSAAWPSKSSPLLDNSRESSKIYSKSYSFKEVSSIIRCRFLLQLHRQSANHV